MNLARANRGAWLGSQTNHLLVRSVRVCLIAITIACSRLRRSPKLICCVEHALRACSTQHINLFARRSRASPRRERAKALRIRQALSEYIQQVIIAVLTTHHDTENG